MFSTLRTQLSRMRTLLREAYDSFSWQGRTAITAGTILGACALFALLGIVNSKFLVSVPADGGTLREGVIGTPRFVNPLLAVTETDRDLSTLLYAGLMRVGADGTLVPDLAESYTVSPDGLVYDFTLRANLTFHDKKPLTAKDVVFTVARAQDQDVKSPKRPNWEGVKAEAVDDTHVRFTLSKPYAPFLENTTLGIIPAHIWEGAPSSEWVASAFNLRPVGSGPFMLGDTTQDSSGIPTSYNLDAWDKFTRGRPHLDMIHIAFFPNETSLITALESGTIEALHGVSGDTAKELTGKGYTVTESPLPRVFGIFLNQAQAPVLADSAVRSALSLTANRALIVDQVLHGYGTAITGPIPPGSLGYEETQIPAQDFDSARALLEKAGWKRGDDGIYAKGAKPASKNKKTPAVAASRLAFTLTVPDVSELKSASDILVRDWKTLGADVTVSLLAMNDVNQNILRPRKYDALFFGEIVGRESDLFAFWHSSQRGDPGLNIALYTNRKADTLLEQARKTSNREDAANAYHAFSTLVTADTPAIFLYAPKFIYLLPKDLIGVSLPPPNVSADRFAESSSWYREVDRVWKVFAK